VLGKCIHGCWQWVGPAPGVSDPQAGAGTGGCYDAGHHSYRLRNQMYKITLQLCCGAWHLSCNLSFEFWLFECHSLLQKATSCTQHVLIQMTQTAKELLSWIQCVCKQCMLLALYMFSWTAAMNRESGICIKAQEIVCSHLEWKPKQAKQMLVLSW
jgi:hypothetical protein